MPEEHSRSGFGKNRWEEGEVKSSQVKSSQVKSGRGHEEEAWRCGGYEMVSTRIEQTRIEGLPLTTSHVHSVVDSVADDIVALLR